MYPTEISIGVISGIAYGQELKTCVCCNRKFCNNCCAESKFRIVDQLWHPDIQRPADARTGIVCESHQRKVIVAYIQDMHDEIANVFIKVVQAYLKGALIPSLPKPTNFSESAMAMRITKLACTVAKYTGYGNYAKALKYAMMGRYTLALLLNKDVTDMLFSLMPLLEEFNIKTPKEMLCVYYLGCKTELQLQQRHTCDMTTEEEYGVISAPCPDSIIDILGKNVAYAQWLYAATLPSPHDSKEWGAWYLDRILEREGWQLAAAHLDSTELPDGALCPAFALVVRDGTKNSADNSEILKSESRKKEAILVIRGSRNLTDWRINVTRKVTAFAYRGGNCGSEVCVGGVHTGMLIAARAILGKMLCSSHIWFLNCALT